MAKLLVFVSGSGTGGEGVEDAKFPSLSKNESMSSMQFVF